MIILKILKISIVWGTGMDTYGTMYISEVIIAWRVYYGTNSAGNSVSLTKRFSCRHLLVGRRLSRLQAISRVVCLVDPIVTLSRAVGGTAGAHLHSITACVSFIGPR